MLSSPDVLIIGGGLIGGSIAWRLRQAGLDVILCEAAQFGGEASWAGAGMLVPGSEYDEPCEDLDFALHSLSLYPGFVRELQELSGHRIEFDLCGSLELAASPADLHRLIQRVHRQNCIPAQILESADLTPIFTTPLAGAVYYPREGQVDPRTLTAALRRVLNSSIRENTPVRSVRLTASGVEAVTTEGTIAATRCVLAAGAWSTQIPGLPSIPTAFPVRGHLLGYRLQPGSIPHVLRFHETYIVQRSTGFTIAGTSIEHVGFDRSVDPAIATAIASRAHSLAGKVVPPRPAEIWTGFRPGVEAPHPRIGRFQNSPLWLAYGHYRNGILLAPATAEKIAREIIASSGTGSPSRS